MFKSKNQIIYELTKCLIDFIDIDYFGVDQNNYFLIDKDYLKCPSNIAFKTALMSLIHLKVIKLNGLINIHYHEYEVNWKALEALKEADNA